jgi:SpoVK/Ycf46/Vps4 family AAA+-type ATPase
MPFAFTQRSKAMKADLLKRLVRAIAEGSQRDLDDLAKKVIESEKQTGHKRLAAQLESIFADTASRRSTVPNARTSRSPLSTLPQSRRHGEQLLTLTPREELEHHMVLPPETEERFARIECEFAARERLDAYGLRPRKTILLHGLPGCGKTLGAKRLAWNTGLPLLKVRFDALISSYFGESASNLRSVFVAAKEHPCVLLLDECDFIARSRVGQRDIGEAGRIVNSLLQLMEEYDAPGLLVATTNIEDALDEALFRRFDEVLLVPPPGAEEIAKLLKTTLAAVKVDSHVDWSAIIKLLTDCSAAMVVKAANDAAKKAVLSGHKVVREADLRTAIGELRRPAKS